MEPERKGGGAATGEAPAGLTETFYGELRAIAERLFARERDGHTLQPTAVVNEACVRLMAHGLPDVPREQRLAIAGRVLKQVLIDHARGHGAAKRGGGGLRLGLDEDVLADCTTLVEFDSIHAALEKLRTLSERQAEVVTLRVFAGMTMDQVASVLGVSKRTAEGEWAIARAWLRRELGPALGLTGPGRRP
jgi:RNA polymerase sigma factor (TIGR02999 family)